MANLTPGTSWTGSATLTKQTGTTLSFHTANKYVDRGIEFALDVQSAAGALAASADANVESTDNGTGGVNIADVIGEKASVKPSSGYYLRVKATGQGNFNVTTPGWLSSGTLTPATGETTVFFPVQAGTASVTGTNTVTPSVSVAGTNVTLGNTNNGISIVASGGGTASATASAVSTQSGYIPNSQSIGSTTLTDTASTTNTLYVSGVTLTTPASGTNTFTVTVPNGTNDTVTFTFTVDANGNTTIE